MAQPVVPEEADWIDFLRAELQIAYAQASQMVLRRQSRKVSGIVQKGAADESSVRKEVPPAEVTPIAQVELAAEASRQDSVSQIGILSAREEEMQQRSNFLQEEQERNTRKLAQLQSELADLRRQVQEEAQRRAEETEQCSSLQTEVLEANPSSADMLAAIKPEIVTPFKSSMM